MQVSKRTSIDRKRRARVIARCYGFCVYCGLNAAYLGEPLQVDHFVPLARGGSNANENLVAACRHCNATKGDMMVEEFRAYLEAYLGVGCYLFDYEMVSFGEDRPPFGIEIGILSHDDYQRALLRADLYGICEPVSP